MPHLPFRVPTARAALRVLAAVALASACAAPAQAHHLDDRHEQGAERAGHHRARATDAGSHAHAGRPTATARTALPRTWAVEAPVRHRWGWDALGGDHAALVGSLGQAYLSSATGLYSASGAAATRSKVLTTAQATKKLSKKCQRLVKVTKPARLSKADRKARTQCLEQRRKIIAASKQKPTTGSTTPTAGSTTSPGTGGSTSPSTGDDDTPKPGATPTPTPKPGTTPTPTPRPTAAPTSTPTPAPDCTSPGTGTVFVTAISEDMTFDASMCGIKAGAITFSFNSSDQLEEHSLVLSDGTNAQGQPTGTIRPISGEIDGGGGPVTKTLTLSAGTYFLVCTVQGHGAMTRKFTVFA